MAARRTGRELSGRRSTRPRGESARGQPGSIAPPSQKLVTEDQSVPFAQPDVAHDRVADQVVADPAANDGADLRIVECVGRESHLAGWRNSMRAFTSPVPTSTHLVDRSPERLRLPLRLDQQLRRDMGLRMPGFVWSGRRGCQSNHQSTISGVTSGMSTRAATNPEPSGMWHQPVSTSRGAGSRRRSIPAMSSTRPGSHGPPVTINISSGSGSVRARPSHISIPASGNVAAGFTDGPSRSGSGRPDRARRGCGRGARGSRRRRSRRGGARGSRRPAGSRRRDPPSLACCRLPIRCSPCSSAGSVQTA